MKIIKNYIENSSTQYTLLYLIERWKKILDNKAFGGAVLMDLAKAFDTLNHELLRVKLSANGFNNGFKAHKSYLTNRWLRTKINKSFTVNGPSWYMVYPKDRF